jgi:hypothetical protein
MEQNTKLSSAMPNYTHTANMKEIFGVDVDCYILDDSAGRIRVIGQRGMTSALAIKGAGSTGFMRTMSSKSLSRYIDSELRLKIDNPIEFGLFPGGIGKGYKATILIDVCKAISAADQAGDLAPSQKNLAVQAAIIVNASAKFGIDNLIDRLTGFDDKRENYIEAFKVYVREEAAEYQKQFPRDFYDVCYQVYGLECKHGKNHPQFFSYLTRNYVYSPLADSNGAILENLDKKNPVIKKPDGKGGYRKYKLHQFLEEVGIAALQNQIGQFIAVGRLSRNKYELKRNFEKIQGRPVQMTLPGFDGYDEEDQSLLI